MSTKIEWTDATWNPTIGCTRVSAGCDHCYAFDLHDKRYVHNTKLGKLLVGLDETLTKHIYDKNWQQITDEMDKPADGWAAEARRRNRIGVGGEKLLPAQYDQPFSRVQLMADRLDKPLHWKKPRKVFVNSMSDLFHEDVPDEFIDRVFAVMALTPQHTYQVLTKRPERMRAFVERVNWYECTREGLSKANPVFEAIGKLVEGRLRLAQHYRGFSWPLPNVWMGTSIEDQAAADERIPHLLATPAAVRFLSCEPLLGELRLWPWTQPVGTYGTYTDEKGVHFAGPHIDGQSPIDWVIVGGESGPHARPFNIAWARSLRDQCSAAGVPVFVKQLGSKPYLGSTPMIGQYQALKLHSRHGSDPEEWPEDLRVREFPFPTSPDARSAPKEG